MSRHNFDCHHHNGYTGCCDLKGGEFHKVCKHFITEDDWLDSIPECDLRVSVAKLREVIMDMAMPTNEFRPEPTIARTIDEIINQVKKSI